MVPKIILVGDFGENAEQFAKKITKMVREGTDLAPKTGVDYNEYHKFILAADDQPAPYFIVANTGEEGADEEVEQLTELLKPLGYDIEHGDIKEYLPAPDFNRWTEEKRLDALAKKFGITRIDLAEMAPDPEIIKLITTEAIWDYKILPIHLELENDCLVVAVVDPLDSVEVDNIRQLAGHYVRQCLCSKSDFIAKYIELFGEDEDPETPAG
ncbi:TPA: hypothetical protein DIV45_03295 [Patescibacteria group bacterium]|nr:hypothetical protein [Patescibacteria group bacterium]